MDYKPPARYGIKTNLVEQNSRARWIEAPVSNTAHFALAQSTRSAQAHHFNCSMRLLALTKNMALRTIVARKGSFHTRRNTRHSAFDSLKMSDYLRLARAYAELTPISTVETRGVQRRHALLGPFLVGNTSQRVLSRLKRTSAYTIPSRHTSDWFPQPWASRRQAS